MSEEAELTKTELVAQINSTWAALDAALRRLSEAQLSAEKDAAGWAVKDHVIHLAAWERAVVFMLSGRPFYAGLGIDEALYLQGSVQAINDAVFAQTADLGAREALADLRAGHAQLLALLGPLPDADLQRRYSAYLQEEPGASAGPLVVKIVYENTAEHYVEHLAWIEVLAGGH